jgi:lipopolysaccharide biosynthesis glycosyltransferase
MNNPTKICLVTVSTANYLQWTMTMIFSFLKLNPWFKGDIQVISADLDEKSFAVKELYPAAYIFRPSGIMERKLKALENAVPKLTGKLARFYSLELFRMTRYDTVLFLDSDMLVTGSLEDLFQLPHGFYACPEWFSGKGRDMESFQSVGSFGRSGSNFIASPVNTGFMLVSGKYLSNQIYEELIDYITPVHWETSHTILTDQLIINKFFNRRTEILSARYNYRPKNAGAILRTEGLTMEEATVIHFILNAKPWNFPEVLKTSATSIALLKAYELWYDRYFEMLAHLHLQNKIIQMKISDGGQNGE